MTIQDKCIRIIKLLGYNTRQAAEALGIATQTVDKKMKQNNNNKFTEKDFDKFSEFIDNLQTEKNKLSECEKT